MPRGLTLALLAAALVFGGSARADDKSHKAAALSLMKAMDMENQLKASIDATLDTMIKGNPMLADKKDVLKTFFTKHMSFDSLKDDYAAIYTKSFSEKELGELEAFYKTPVGKKMAGKTAEIGKQAMELGMKKVQDNQAELIKMLQDK